MFVARRMVGGSSRGSGQPRIDSVAVDAGDWSACEKCGGLRLGRGPHAPLWRDVGGRFRIVDCAGDVVDRRLVEGKPYEDEETQ